MASSHLKALLKKNWILTKRSWCWSLCEILIPALFSLLFFAFRMASPLEDQPITTHYSTPFTFNSSSSLAALSTLKHCNGPNNGGFVALAPASDPIILSLNNTLSSNFFDKFVKIY